jgi:hypothetical protein
MLTHDFNYRSLVEVSERVAWKIDDIINDTTNLDFTRAFLPNSLVLADEIKCLSASEKLTLNQIRGNSYVHLFGFVEEYIIALAVRHASAEIFGDEASLRALLRFAEEESKHQTMFKRFGAVFARGFKTECGVIGGAETVAGVILSKSPIAVVLITLHLELATQAHFVECFREGKEDVDPLFRQMFRAHWLEEAQHAKIDLLELEKLVGEANEAIVDTAFKDYLDLLGALDGLLIQQAKLDIESLARATGRAFSEAETAEILAAQRKAYRRTFIVYGMTNPSFIKWIGEIAPAWQERVAAAVALYTD